MKALAAVCLLLLLATPGVTDIVHDEAIHGDLSSDPAAPTSTAFNTLNNTIRGTMTSAGGVDRDYITFTLESDRIMTGLILHALSPDNLAFASFNAGATSFIPSGATAASFLAGIHPGGSDVGNDLMPLFVSNSVTGNSLPGPSLGPGTYCFLIQQTSPIDQVYELEFIVSFVLPVERSTWGTIKALYSR